MKKSNEILWSNSSPNNDEKYTPCYGVYPVLKYIPEWATIWCPFDTKESWFVKLISQTNKVVYSHIDAGQDFFKYEPDNWDILISNPPFKGKRQIFERALSFEKPFALLMTLTWLNDSSSKTVFIDARTQMQLLMFDKRIVFGNTGLKKHKITFSSGYYCRNFLPRDIMLERICRSICDE